MDKKVEIACGGSYQSLGTPIILKIKNWAICKLAGRRTIILNAKISPIPKTVDGYPVLVDECVGSLICRNQFDLSKGFIEIRDNK